MVVLLKIGCSVRHKFCTIYVPLSEAKIFQEPLRSSSFLVKLETGDQRY